MPILPPAAGHVSEPPSIFSHGVPPPPSPVSRRMFPETRATGPGVLPPTTSSPLFPSRHHSSPPRAAYARPTGVAPVFPPTVELPAPQISPGEQSRRHFSHRSNVGIFGGDAPPEPSPRGKGGRRPEQLITIESPTVPFHIKRLVREGRDTDSDIIASLRAGVGFAHAGDKPYARVEEETGFFSDARPDRFRPSAAGHHPAVAPAGVSTSRTHSFPQR